MIRTLLGALQFLTVLPIRRNTAPPGRCVGWFPLVGALLGVAGSGVFYVTSMALPRSIAALVTIAFWVFASGGLHEDGLADSADAFRAGRAPGRILAILKDSRIGAFGGLALCFSLLLRWQAVERLSPSAFAIFAVTQALPRTMMVLLAYTTRPATRGLGGGFSLDLTWPWVGLAVISMLALLALLPPAFALFLVVCNLLLLSVASDYFDRRIGGVTGDCLGALAQLSEILTLLLFLCPLSPLYATLNLN
jgi:adenosylcobinamide-GDP ribazoletransferase